MCGIAGILVKQGGRCVRFEELRRMAAMLRHRGPDGHGLYRDEAIGLAHLRLSIIDLSGGAQPLHNETRSIWAAVNGEIFNYLELREQLEALGHRFATHSDSEVAIHAYEEYGGDAWARLNGQFAIALWDRCLRRLWLVRDRLGILPLHYARVPGRVLFASEAKALFAGGHLCPEFDPQGLAQTFTRWAATPPATIFRHVRSVRPASALCIDDELRQTETTYWQPEIRDDAAGGAMTVPQAADALQTQLAQAVRFRLRADVPVGVYISGGLDSSVIAQLTRQAHTARLESFSIRFEDPAFDETAAQRRMAELLGTEHHEILCGPADIRSALPDVVWHCETALLRSAPAPLFLLSGLVRRSGLKVVLTGEGADELFAGYDIFKEDKVRRFWARQPDSEARPALLSRLYPDVASARQRRTRMWQQFFGHDLTNSEDPFYSHAVRWRNSAWALQFLSPELRPRGPEAPEDALDRRWPADWRNWRPLARAQLIEMATFLSPYLLSCQGDRVAMAHAVEVRYPFLDPQVVDACCAMPGSVKLRGLSDKLALRALASRHVPPEIWKRPKKPYRSPMTHALLGSRWPAYAEELLCERALTRLGLVDTSAALKLLDKARRQDGRMISEREEMAVLAVLTLQMLGHFYMERFAARETEAAEALAAEPPTICVDAARGPAQAFAARPG